MVLSTPQFVYDPSTLEFQEHIWDVYRMLRDEYPVYVDEAKHQYVLSRFDDVWRAVNDWETFSSVVEEAENFLPQMIYMDPVRHTQLRALVSRAFTPKRVAEIEPLTRSIARDLVDGIAARGRCDLQHEYAAVLPSVVIGKMIGVPDEHVDAFRSWTDSFLEIQGPQDYLDSLGKCYELFAELLAERRRTPRDDLMSALLAAEVDGQRLTRRGAARVLLPVGARGQRHHLEPHRHRCRAARDGSGAARRARARPVVVGERDRGDQPPRVTHAGPAPHDDV